MLTAEEIKRHTGEHAASFIEDGMTVGLGTGTTAYWFVLALGKLVKNGLHCTGIPTSARSLELAMENGIKTASLNDVDSIDITVDGADEIDPQLRLIKGGGGALLQEKMVAAASKQELIIADYTKLVSQLGAFPLPVEVIPYGFRQVQKKIADHFSIKATPRLKNGAMFTTDHGHCILDCHFGKIEDPVSANEFLKSIPGVVETGLFINMTSKVLAGYPDGTIKEITISQ